jgi:hypothetical protein
MIYVFKTSVETEKEICELKPDLDKLLPQAKWNFDLDDCDRILRIDSQTENTQAIIKLLQDTGYECEEIILEPGNLGVIFDHQGSQVYAAIHGHRGNKVC